MTGKNKPGKVPGNLFAGFLVNVFVLLASLLLLFPLAWIIISSMKSQVEVLKNPLSLIPRPNMFINNFLTVLSRADWPVYYKNTLVLCASVWAVQMLIAIPAAYAFGVMNFRGRKILFFLILTRLLVSPESTMLANYMTVLKMGAYDTLAGILLPYAVSAQAIFIFRQAFRQIPSSLRESARIDGCGDFLYILRIGIPLIQPYIISFSVVTCVFQWNAFFWPMVITKSPSKRILPVALTFFGMQAESGSEWALTMTAALIVILPLLVVFGLFQRRLALFQNPVGFGTGLPKRRKPEC
jgi:ABC-type glycerol-3-phosphate transport system permease component